jgi:hypothetical protein
MSDAAGNHGRVDRVGTQAMSDRRIANGLFGVLFVVVLLTYIALMMFTPAPTPQYVVPRIVDEHGNNLVYVCPGDPRCTPTPTR